MEGGKQSLTGPGKSEGEKGGGESGTKEDEDGGGGGGGWEGSVGGEGSGTVDDRALSLAAFVVLSAPSIHAYNGLLKESGTVPLHRSVRAGGGLEEAIVASEAMKAEGEMRCVSLKPKPPRGREVVRG